MSPTTGGGGIKIVLWLKFNKSGGLSSEGHYSVNANIIAPKGELSLRGGPLDNLGGGYAFFGKKRKSSHLD